MEIYYDMYQVSVIWLWEQGGEDKYIIIQGTIRLSRNDKKSKSKKAAVDFSSFPRAKKLD